MKRRRAEAKKESKRESIPAPVGAAEQHKGQPDLAELSKGLPSGWQVSGLPCLVRSIYLRLCFIVDTSIMKAELQLARNANFFLTIQIHE